jgi:membrane-associated phospholipid phosphatase
MTICIFPLIHPYACIKIIKHMKNSLLLHLFILCLAIHANGQLEPDAGEWKAWFITSPKEYRLPPPPLQKEDLAQVLMAQRSVDSAGMQKIIYWNAGAPGYRWYDMVSRLWMTDITGNGALANALIGTGIYDATIAAWDTKYTYNRPRPFAASKDVKLYAPKPESPSYPCEHSVAAGVAVGIISHFYPALADSANRMAQEVMASRVAAGVAFPNDTRAGFELGKKIAAKEIEQTKSYITNKQFDGKIPQKPGLWNGKNPMLPLAGLNKTIVLDSASQFRPDAPPDFAKEMSELKNFKHTFSSRANAFYYASQPAGNELLTKKIFEYNLNNNPPRAARIYAAVNVAFYDAFTACWDTKYAYWGIRPDQYDSTYKPLMASPPFPGYPSGHAMMSGVVEELFPYFFPYDKKLFKKIATDGAESRFHAGIHFRSDNDAGLELGRNVASKVIERLEKDGAEQKTTSSTLKNLSRKN